jgi:hypothetical protein
MAQEFKFDLGTEVMEKITQFHGVVVARAQWLTQCNTYAIQSRDIVDGKPVERQWFDEPMLESVDAVVKTVFEDESEVKRPGGPSVPISPTNRPK